MNFRRFLIAFSLVSFSFCSAQQPPADNSIGALQARAESGDVKAQTALGRAYRDGEGVPQNNTRAFDWFMKAAKAGDAEAQNAVALQYRDEHNFTESLKWYSLAAKQGSGNAMFNIGTHYYNGDGVATSDTEAYAWFLLAKKNGSKRAEDAVKRAETDLTPGQLSDGKLRVADLLAEGKEVPRDITTAVAVYEDAGRYGRPELQMRLAKVFLNGWGVPEEPAKAESYCRRALELDKNYTSAMLCLAFLDQSGKLGSAGGKSAIVWYEKAFKTGNPVAAYGLGVAYATGKGTQQNLEKALTYLVIAALSNIEVATPLAKQVEQRLPPEVAKKSIKKANDEKKRGIYSFGMVDKEFAYVVKVDQLP